MSIIRTTRQYASVLVGDDGLVPDGRALDIVTVLGELSYPMSASMVDEYLVGAHRMTKGRVWGWRYRSRRLGARGEEESLCLWGSGNGGKLLGVW